MFVAADTWKRLSWQMGTNKATGKPGRMIDIVCRPFLSSLLINHPALLATARLIFLFTLKFFHVVLFSSTLSAVSLLCFFPSQIGFNVQPCVVFHFFYSEAFAGDKARTLPLPLVSSLTMFLLFMSNNFPAPGNTNSFSINCCICSHCLALKIRQGMNDLPLPLFFAS